MYQHPLLVTYLKSKNVYSSKGIQLQKLNNVYVKWTFSFIIASFRSVKISPLFIMLGDIMRLRKMQSSPNRFSRLLLNFSTRCIHLWVNVFPGNS